MSVIKCIVACAIALTIFTTTLCAQESPSTPIPPTTIPPTTPTATPSPADTPIAAPIPIEQLPIRIVATKGLAQYRLSEEEPWQKAAPDIQLTTGAEFRTGPRSRIQFAVGDDHLITLDRLGVIKVLDAIKQDGKVYTEMGMMYGRSSYQVQLGGVEHEARITTPTATLAVRGSLGFIEAYVGRPPIAGSDYGNVAFTNSNGIEVAMKPKTRLQGAQTSAAQQSLQTGVFLPTAAGVTPQEQAVVNQQPLFGTPGTGGSGGSFQSTRQENTLPPPPSSQSFDIGAAGLVRAQLIWHNDADLDLHMFLPDSTHVYYSNTSVDFNDNYAHVELDHDNVGGTIDIEPDLRIENIAVTGIMVPAGLYNVYANLFSDHGNSATPYTLIVTGDAQQPVQIHTGTFSSDNTVSPTIGINSPGGSFNP